MEKKVINKGFNENSHVDFIRKWKNDSEIRIRQRNRNLNNDKKIIIVFFYIFMLAMLFISLMRTMISTGVAFIGYYSLITGTYFLIKGTLAMFYKGITEEFPNQTVSVVIPCYNEGPEQFMTLVTSIFNQEYPIEEIFILDDGSTNREAYDKIVELVEYILSDTQDTSEFQKPKVNMKRFEKNRGKRIVQAYAFERVTSDFVLTVDSDGYLYPDALLELMKPFKDEKVKAATGHINAINKSENFFTELINMRYDNAFRIERAAQSTTKSVLCCSGPISCYRASVICTEEAIYAYTHQQLFGHFVSVGDDRCLTNYCLVKGEVVYQHTSQCDSTVPSKYRVWIKQQIRWNKSFFRETMISISHSEENFAAAIWSFLEFSTWVFFIFTLVFKFIFNYENITYIDILFLLITTSLSSYARNIFFINKDFKIFLMAPVYGFIHLFTINIVRIYALLTINVNKWGTR